MTPKPPTAVSHPIEEIYLEGLDVEELRCEAMARAYAALMFALEKRDDVCTDCGDR